MIELEKPDCNNDFVALLWLSWGVGTISLTHGLGGIRGEVEGGMSLVSKLQWAESRNHIRCFCVVRGHGIGNLLRRSTSELVIVA